MSVKINKNGKEYHLGFMPEHYPADRVYLDGDTSKAVQDAITGLKTIIKSKTMSASTVDSNNVCATGLYTSNAIPIAVNCEGMTAYIGSIYLGEWLVGFYSYGTGEMIPVTNKQITIYYIDLTKISVQS